MEAGDKITAQEALASKDSAAIFTLKNVSLGYEPGHNLLENLDFSLFPGQKIGFFGPNACGKTSFFRCITGLLLPRTGQIFFHVKPLAQERDFYPLRCKVGFLLQQSEDQLFFPTVLEDVAFGPLNLGLKADAAREQAELALAALGLASYAGRLIPELSGGEKRMVALAAVLAMQPEALLLDEPTTGLDEAAQARLLEILHGLPVALICISHDLDFLSQLASQFMTIRDHKLEFCAAAPLHSHSHCHPLGDLPHSHRH